MYADPILGNVIEHVAAETAAGKTIYIGTRLKLVDKKIKEIEINFDDGPRVNMKNLLPYDPIFNTIVPPDALSASGGNIDSTTGQVLTAGNFGRIISTSNNPRIIQFALKFNF